MTLREAVRAAMQLRRVDYEAVAKAAGCAASTIKLAMGRRPPPSPTVAAGLQRFVDAPAVASSGPE
jgi:hypothetical protein